MAISKKTQATLQVGFCESDVRSVYLRLAELAQDPDLWFARADLVYAMTSLEKAKDLMSRARVDIANNFEKYSEED